MTETATLCPCGSQVAYQECCEPLIIGSQQAETAEQLMRSRYTAYVKGALRYLYDTTHPDLRKGYDHDGTKEWAENSDWKGLEIISVKGGGASESYGEVEFKACYAGGGAEQIHHEMGRFRKKEGTWFFTDGKLVGRLPVRSDKVGRNDPCPCGSGAKYKKCCGK